MAARASGVDTDFRRDHPHDAYEDLRMHQQGFMAGMRSALAVVLARFGFIVRYRTRIGFNWTTI